MDASLLEFLCCPMTHQALRPADPAVLAQASAKASRVIEEGLVREDGRVVYPVAGGIPLLLPEEGITL